MATATRTVQQGDSIILYIEVRDIYGVLVDSSTTPQLSIFPFDADPRDPMTSDSDALVLNSTAAIHIAQGIYSYTYTIATDAHVGTWFDRWIVTIDDKLSTAILSFSIIPSSPVTDEASINTGTIVLMQNNVIVITIDSTVTSDDEQELGEDYQYYFTTTYNPLYSSVRKVVLRAGGYMSSIPDDTVNLAIFEASLEADAITFGMKFPPQSGTMPESWELASGEISPTYYSTRTAGGPYLTLAREKYVTCMAIWFILSNSLGPSAKKKRLADFSVDYTSGSVPEFVKQLRQECEDWESVLNSGGYISKGSSLPSVVALRGVYNPDAPQHGRRMMPAEGIPASNTKIQYPTLRSRWKHAFVRR